MPARRAGFGERRASTDFLGLEVWRGVRRLDRTAVEVLSVDGTLLDGALLDEALFCARSVVRVLGRAHRVVFGLAVEIVS